MNKREMKRAKKIFLKKEDTEGKWQKMGRMLFV